jgi:hypothetical protein
MWWVKLGALLAAGVAACTSFDSAEGQAPSDASAEAYGQADAVTDAPGDAGPPPCDGAAACERVVFLTSGSFDGNLGGLSGADARCTSAAGAADASLRVRGRAFQAWLSTSMTSAGSRLPHGTAPYVMVDGSRVATDWNGLVSVPHIHPITLDETGAPLVAALSSVWTGTHPDGGPSSPFCLDWTSADGGASGTTGSVTAATEAWSEQGQFPCDSRRPLYCIER